MGRPTPEASVSPVGHTTLANFMFLTGRRYLRRYQLVALLRLLDEHVGVEEKTPEKMITMLQAHCSIEPTATVNPSSGIQPRRDHLPRAQIASVLASEAEWLLATQMVAARSVTLKNLLDISSWHEFCLTARKTRIGAARHNFVWGQTNKKDNIRSTGTIDFTQFGGTAAEWDRKLDLLVTNPRRKKAKVRVRTGYTIEHLTWSAY